MFRLKTKLAILLYYLRTDTSSLTFLHLFYKFLHLTGSEEKQVPKFLGLNILDISGPL